MGICSSKKKSDNSKLERSKESFGDIWEVNVLSLRKYVKNNNITQKSLMKRPFLCNYIILEKNGYRVIRIKMEYKNGVYTKYPTDQSLRWHVSLIGLPINATVLLKDKQLHNLYHNSSGL
jgi:hypothetical protein